MVKKVDELKVLVHEYEWRVKNSRERLTYYEEQIKDYDTKRSNIHYTKKQLTSSFNYYKEEVELYEIKLRSLKLQLKGLQPTGNEDIPIEEFSYRNSAHYTNVTTTVRDIPLCYPLITKNSRGKGSSSGTISTTENEKVLAKQAEMQTRLKEVRKKQAKTVRKLEKILERAEAINLRNPCTISTTENEKVLAKQAEMQTRLKEVRKKQAKTVRKLEKILERAEAVNPRNPCSSFILF